MFLAEVSKENEKVVEAFSDRVMSQIDSDPKDKYSQLQAYLQPIRRYPVLRKPEQYLPLFASYRTGSDGERLDARNQLVYGNIKLVIWVAFQQSGKGLPLLDLIQEGVIGLMRAIELYDPSLGFRFATYAPHWIRQAMSRAIANTNHDRPFRIPVHMLETMAVVKGAMSRFMTDHGRWGSGLEIYETIRGLEEVKDVSLWKVRQCLHYIITGNDELDAPAYGNEEADETLGERSVLTSPVLKTETVVEARSLLVDYRAALSRVEAAIDALSPCEAQILRLRSGLGEFEAMTLEEVGNRYGLTRERIRQIEAKAWEKISTSLDVTAEQVLQIVEVIDELERIVESV